MKDFLNMVHCGDCLQSMKSMKDNTIDAVITDPPYGLSKSPDMKSVLQHWLKDEDYKHNSAGFMSKEWDSFVPGPKVWYETFRIVKDNGLIMSFGGTRTIDLTLMAMRIAAERYEIDTGTPIHYVGDYYWVQGQGFPKSFNIAKGLEKKGEYELAKKFKGYGTALKPAYEPVVIFRKGNNRQPDYPDGVNFLYTSKATKKERNAGCEELYWLKDKPISKEEYKRLMAENDKSEKKMYYLLRGNPHPTCKPMAIMDKLVELTGLKDGVILDPFSGSGTTVCAAIRRGLHGIGFDVEDTSMMVANSRITYYKGQKNEPVAGK